MFNTLLFQAVDPKPGREWLCTISKAGDPHVLTFCHGSTREEVERKANEYMSANAEKIKTGTAKRGRPKKAAVEQPTAEPETTVQNDEEFF